MNYQFEVGKTYLTQRGEAVRVVLRHAELRGYETVMGDDGIHRYDRSSHNSDAGRCTGSPHDYSDPENFARPAQAVEWVPAGAEVVVPIGRCPDCYGAERPGFKRGLRCVTCDGTATVPCGVGEVPRG